MKDRKNEKIAYNDSSENLDDIFLIKDKNKPKANKERSSEEKARKPIKLWIILKRCKSLERDGTKNRRMKFTMKEMDSLDLKALLNKSQEKLKEEKAIKCLWKI